MKISFQEPAERHVKDDTVPAGRQGSSLCVLGNTAERTLLLLFGGRVGSSGRHYCNDTWMRPVGQGELWKRIDIGGETPRKRHNHSLVAFSQLGILFGGSAHGRETSRGRYEQDYLNDMWVFDSERLTWTLVNAAQAPAPSERHCHSMVVAEECALLFGGFGGAQREYLNDVWILNGNLEWTQLAVTKGRPSPRPRNQHASCWHNGRLFVFGGYYWDGTREHYLGDLWSMCPHEEAPHWTQHSCSVSPRNRSNLVSLGLRGRLLLINGNYYANRRGTDVWYQQILVYDAGRDAWTQAESDSRAPHQSHMACCMDEASQTLYLFGGEKSKKRFNTLHIAELGIGETADLG